MCFIESNKYLLLPYGIEKVWCGCEITLWDLWDINEYVSQFQKKNLYKHLTCRINIKITLVQSSLCNSSPLFDILFPSFQSIILPKDWFGCSLGISISLALQFNLLQPKVSNFRYKILSHKLWILLKMMLPG